MDNLNSMPDISVVVPVFNGEEYIYKCVDALLQQTFKNFEIVIVDNGSTDRTYDILREYKKIFQIKFPFIR